MISKPKNNKELTALVGKTAVLDNYPGTNVQKALITGISATKNENPYADGEFNQVFIMVNYKPKSIHWDQIKDIEDDEIADAVDAYPVQLSVKWICIWTVLAFGAGFLIGTLIP